VITEVASWNGIHNAIVAALLQVCAVGVADR
jgi:hypothetical protein